MKVLVIEDDYMQGEMISEQLRREFPEVLVDLVSTEYEFRSRFEDIATECPRIAIIDILLPWTRPGVGTPPGPEVLKHGFFHAGLRCARMLTQDPRTRACPVIIHSVVDEHAVQDELRSLGPNVVFISKMMSDRLLKMVRLISQLPPGISSLATEVFVVHGRDAAARESVARFLERIGLAPIILFEQAGRGAKTIIEKLELHSRVSCAIVLLTPDDVGGLSPQELRPRARQNVIFELGYFVGCIGRSNVFTLYKEGVELPSDYHGVCYIPMDEAGAWRVELARELRTAGLTVNLNHLL
jgi:CheY-like chemotaxis protein